MHYYRKRVATVLVHGLPSVTVHSDNANIVRLEHRGHGSWTWPWTTSISGQYVAPTVRLLPAIYPQKIFMSLSQPNPVPYGVRVATDDSATDSGADAQIGLPSTAPDA
eukprot:6205603-Pleurochrysis_carterae.AAC.1